LKTCATARVWLRGLRPTRGTLKQTGWKPVLLILMKRYRDICRMRVRDAFLRLKRERLYRRWMMEREGDAVRELAGEFSDDGPLISVLVPIHETPVEMLHQCIRSVIKQTYGNWQLCLVDDGSARKHGEILRVVEEAQSEVESRIVFRRLEESTGISGATNEALKMADGEYIAFLDHDDTLSPHALAAVARAVSRETDVDVVYTDEDKIDANGRRFSPTFKPGFSPHALMAWNYVCHLLVVRTELVRAVGGLQSEFDGAQDYDLILRLLGVTRRVVHVPMVGYHWRVHRGSTSGRGARAKPYVLDASKRALTAFFESQSVPVRVEPGPVKMMFESGAVVESDDLVEVRLTRKIKRAGRGRVVDFVNRSDRVSEVVEFDNGTLFDRPKGDEAQWLLFVDPNLVPMDGDWLERLIGAAKLPFAGPVGGVIVGSDGLVVDAGLLIDSAGWVGRRYAGVPENHPGYRWSLVSMVNVGAVDLDCLLVDREVAAQVWPGDGEQWGIELACAMRSVGRFAVVVGGVRLRQVGDVLDDQLAQRVGDGGGILNPGWRWIDGDVLSSCRSDNATRSTTA